MVMVTVRTSRLEYNSNFYRKGDSVDLPADIVDRIGNAVEIQTKADLKPIEELAAAITETVNEVIEPELETDSEPAQPSESKQTYNMKQTRRR